MIISRTPLRISFVGGGSDIASFYRHQTGAVVSTAINKYIYIMISKQFDGRIIVQYSKTEIVKRVSDIENNLVREAMKLTGVDGGVHITSISDVSAEGTGMGSSSSYVVGLLNALYAYQGRYVSAGELARQACAIEIDILKKPIGKQDQYIAAYGGFQYIQFNPDESVYVDPIVCLSKTKRKLETRLLLFYTGLTRSSDPILAKQRKNMEAHVQKRETMQTMVALAGQLHEDINNNCMSTFGQLLHRNWNLKKLMEQTITTDQIDRWYEMAMKQGAIGGKILGAGGGGFLLLYAKLSDHKKIKRALSELVPLDIQLEPQGSKIIFVGD